MISKNIIKSFMNFFNRGTYRNIYWYIEKLKLLIKHPFSASKSAKYFINRFIADQESRFGKYNHKYKIIFLSGMAMSGTTWMKNLLARLPGYYTRGMPMNDEIVYSQGICDSAFSNLPKNGYSLYKTHLNPETEYLDCIFRNGVKKIIITHRDLRDIILSRYYRLINYPKPINSFDYIDYRSIGFEKAIDHSIEIVGSDYKKWILGWLENKEKYPDKILIIKFEDMKSDTKKEFTKVLDFYHIKLEDKKINQIIEECRGKKTQDIGISRILPWGLSSNFRSGKIGEWKNQLNPKQIDRCKFLFGDVLIKTGYEENLDW